MTEKMKMIEALIHDLTKSVEIYEKTKKERHYAEVGYGVSRFNGKESIKRRITVAREELLKVSKMM